MPRRTVMARGYFALQGAAVLAWWGLLLFVPSTRAAFMIHGAPAITLGAFAPGDLALISLGSFVSAGVPDRPWNQALSWIVAGAMMYAALYTIATATVGASGWLGALLMTPAAVASTWAAARRG